MKNEYILGIDGGGTKTKFIVSNTNGEIVLEFTMPTIHYLQVGLNGLFRTLEAGLHKITNSLNINQNQIIGVFCGTPGYGDIIKDSIKIENIIRDVFRNSAVTIGNDTLNAHAGALALKPGICVIAGTGSIGIGINEKEEQFISGGWHQAFSGDEGSAHWIAEKYIQEFTMQSDGRSKKTKLFEFMTEKHNFNHPSEALNKFIVEWNYDRTKIASLSKDVYQLAQMNDPAAIKIFNEAAYEISRIYLAIYSNLKFKNHPVQASYVGGVFNSGEFILKPLNEYMNNLDIAFHSPIFHPEIGSLLLGFKAANLKISSKVIENIKIAPNKII